MSPDTLPSLLVVVRGLSGVRCAKVGPKHDIIFMITKMGFLFLFDIYSGKALYRAKISDQTIFVTTTQVGGSEQTPRARP